MTRPFVRSTVKTPKLLGSIIAYDFETTPILTRKGGSAKPKPLYLTAHGANYRFSRAIRSREALAAILESEFLSQPSGTRFVGWNANRFDVRFIFEAIALYCPAWIVRPYATRSGTLRGASVYHRDDSKRRYEFLDGMAMTGLQTTLAKFVATFAPHVPKLEGTIDFAGGETFDRSNPAHVAYAERDSEALYEAITRVRTVVRDLTRLDVRSTIGNLGIRYFERNLPEGVKIWPVRGRWAAILRDQIMRGGYVHTERQFDGPIYAYDLNQAYAAAMRETALPCGNTLHTSTYHPGRPGIYSVTISRDPKVGLAPIPFYCVTDDESRIYARGDRPVKTAITSIEIETLRSFGWTVTIADGLMWDASFSMSEMVDGLEALRTSCRTPDACILGCTCPSDPIGTLCKSLGCNAYGKTTEQFGNLDIVIAHDAPDGSWMPFAPENPDLDLYWSRRSGDEPRERPYHVVQLGAFITASVRMKLYAAAMKAPEAFIKADTDSVTFTVPVPSLDIDPKRYGAWKVEASGTRAIVIGKKTYATFDRDGGFHAVCKGISPKLLTVADYERWIVTGEPPEQEMVQLISWRTAGLLGPMYRFQKRRGTDFHSTQDPPKFFGEPAPL